MVIHRLPPTLPIPHPSPTSDSLPSVRLRAFYGVRKAFTQGYLQMAHYPLIQLFSIAT